MSRYTKADILEQIQKNNVRFIRLQFTDMFGAIKNVVITSGKIEKALDNECMFDGSSIEGFVRIEESDMYLHPDLDTFLILPWSRQLGGKTARLICDVYKPDGTPFEGDPRFILKKALKNAADMGFTLNVGLECEFFLFNTDEFGHPTTVTHDTAGYFDLGPADLGESARRDICLTMEEMGYEVEASHHELAMAQHEIDFKYQEALCAADQMMTFKMVVKNVANAHGLCASFMPKPLSGQAGSGLHTNISLFKNGENVFYDPESENGLSSLAHHFIAGVIRHIKAICPFTNPIVNSYKRLVTGYEAPRYIAWTTGNRSALVRVPSARGIGTRVELRNPDLAANPYLQLAVLLAAGLEGIREELQPPAPVGSNIYDMTPDERQEKEIDCLPANLIEAVQELKQDPFICEALGEHVYQKYIEAKEQEWNRFNSTVTQWELEEYLEKF